MRIVYSRKILYNVFRVLAKQTVNRQRDRLAQRYIELSTINDPDLSLTDGVASGAVIGVSFFPNWTVTGLS